MESSPYRQLTKGTQVPQVDTMIKLEAALGLERAALIEGIIWNPAVGPSGEFKLEQPEQKDDAKKDDPPERVV